MVEALSYFSAFLTQLSTLFIYYLLYLAHFHLSYTELYFLWNLHNFFALTLQLQHFQLPKNRDCEIIYTQYDEGWKYQI